MEFIDLVLVYVEQCRTADLHGDTRDDGAGEGEVNLG